MRNMRHIVIASIALVCTLPLAAFANGRNFSYTYQTHVQKPDAQEIAVWTTYRSERVDFYRQIDNRAEFLFGIATNLESAVYLNSSFVTQEIGDALVSSQSMSVSNRWQYQLLDHETAPLGLALFGELTLGTHGTKVEGKLLFDKHFGHLLVALNAGYEQEWESEIAEGHVESEALSVAELNLGLAYLFGHHVSAGIEARMHNEMKDGKTKHSALFVGPALAYSTEHWWATLSVMPQVASLEEKTDGSLDLVLYEKMQGRLLLAFIL